MSRPDEIWAADGWSPYFYERGDNIPETASKYFLDDVYFEAWQLAVSAERTERNLSRRDYLQLVARGPDDLDEVQAARRLLKKDRYQKISPP